ncbi:MAG TPA: hypothetical protein DHW71_02760 [Gammaproteobacteria bacterium]|nr:hypothetical protein [Gammaproteobacteria bacterium]HBF08211.1 hypothetical protein [Gammaproteobacteria bacterium]HCK91877.1 hypothetical protein [Gammaproteobacteria bacterium]
MIKFHLRSILMSYALQSKTLNEVLFEMNDSNLKCYFVEDDRKGFDLSSLSITSTKWIYIDIASNATDLLLLDKVTEILGQLATKHWPYWYEQSAEYHRHYISNIENQSTKQQSLDWYNRVRHLAELGIIPIADELSLEDNARELFKIYAPAPVVVILSLIDQNPSPEKVEQVADLALWLASLNAANIAVFLPQSLKGSRLLRHISGNTEDITYFKTSMNRDSDTLLRERGLQRRSFSTNITQLKPFKPKFASNAERSIRLTTGLTIGQPHPFSPAEKVLFRSLMQDHELSHRFQCNVPVQGKSGRTYISDFLIDNLVFEIDGFEYHSEYFKGCHDQRRELDLALNGFQIIKISHDEILIHASDIIEDIRSIIHYPR